jgi:tRNA(Arg) A34 adenosine deaminase TadA
MDYVYTLCMNTLKAKHKHHLTAVVYDRKGRVLSIGQNSYLKTHPKQKELSVKAGYPEKEFIHAETAAILKVKDLSKAYRIRVTRVGRSGDLLLAKPCEICMSYIRASGIKVIEHS